MRIPDDELVLFEGIFTMMMLILLLVAIAGAAG